MARKAADFLKGGGEMGDLIAAFDWTRSLGPIETWPTSLTTTVALMVHSPIPQVLLWGTDGIMIYNDAYARFAGRRHPELLGKKVREAWPEVADFNDNIMKVVMAGGTLSYTDRELVLDRTGTFEQGWMDLGYSPVIAEDGKPGGVIAIVVETTERVLAERAVTNERDRLAEMFAQAPSFMALLNGPDHRFTLANPGYMRMVAHRPLLGRTVSEALPEVVEQGFVDLLDEVYRTGKSYSALGAKVALLTDAGDIADRYLDFVYQPLTDSTGSVTGIFVQGVDVTEAFVAEQRRDALMKLSDAFAEVETSAEAEFEASKILARQLGVPRVGYGGIDSEAETLTVDRDWTAKGMPSLSGSLNLRDYGSFIEDLKRGQVVSIADIDADPRTAPKADAIRGRQTEAFVNVPVIERGDLVAMLIVNSDRKRQWSDDELNFVREVAARTRMASERMRARSDLQASEARLRFIDRLNQAAGIEQSAGAVLQTVTRMTGEFMGVSICAYADMDADEDGFTILGDWTAPGSQSIVGHYSLADFGKMAVENLSRGMPLIINNNLKEIAPAEAAVFQAIGVTATICMPLVKQGRLTALMAIHDKNPHYWTAEEAALIREITERSWAHIERVAAETELKKINATLEERVRERTQQLMDAEAALRQAQKMEAVGQLTGGIAHDFNNMLAVVIGGLNMMQRRLARGDTNITKYIDGAMEGATRATSLTQRLLAFSRLAPLEPSSIDANRLVGGMTELLSRTLGEHIQIETVRAAGLWRTFADPLQLESAMLNLAVNARDAMPSGGKLTIETGNAEIDDRAALTYTVPAGQYVMIAVTDTGTGMSPDIVDKAFDPFFTTKSVGRGTGLGLSQVFGFVRQSGGHVKLYSEVGVGTTVKIYLPRHFGASEANDIAQRRTTADPGTPAETILVVEDDERVRRYSIEALKELGYSVIEATGGADALRIIDAGEKVDLLFTDVVMPEMNGRQLADHALKRLPDLKVLFTTGYTRNAVVHNGVLDPGTFFLQKPFTVDQLAAKLRATLDGE